MKFNARAHSRPLWPDRREDAGPRCSCDSLALQARVANIPIFSLASSRGGGRSGLEALERLRAIDPDVHAIIITVHANADLAV